MRRHSSTGASTIGPRSMTPALLTRVSRRPNRSIVASTMARAWASSVTSVSRTRTSSRTDPVGEGLEPVPAPGGDGHLGPGGGQCHGRGLADPAGCTRDQGHGPVESIRHGDTPLPIRSGSAWSRRQRGSVPRRSGTPTTGERTRGGVASGGRALAVAAPARIASAPAGPHGGVERTAGGGGALVECAPLGAVVPGEMDLARGLDADAGRCRTTRAGPRRTAPRPASTPSSATRRSTIDPLSLLTAGRPTGGVPTWRATRAGDRCLGIHRHVPEGTETRRGASEGDGSTGLVIVGP